MSKVDLHTDYLGLRLRSPIVASPGPLTGRIETLRRLQAAGVGAVVLPSLFEEEIVGASMALHEMHTAGTESFAEASSFLPELEVKGPAERYVELLTWAKRHLDVPVIASLNGLGSGSWVSWAEELAAAGADALELNVYVIAADPGDTAATVEARLIDLVRSVRAAIGIPLAVKLSPYFSALGHVAEQIAGSGANGLVLFNRFSQPDFDLDEMCIVPGLELSTPVSLRLPLRWIGLLHGRVPCSLALSGGVESSLEVIKGIAAGADVAMTTSSLLRHGPEHVATLLRGVEEWLLARDYESIGELRGSMSQSAVPNPDGYERANYLQAIRRTTQKYVPSGSHSAR